MSKQAGTKRSVSSRSLPAKRRQANHLGQKPPPTQALRSRGFKRRWEL